MGNLKSTQSLESRAEIRYWGVGAVLGSWQEHHTTCGAGKGIPRLFLMCPGEREHGVQVAP